MKKIIAFFVLVTSVIFLTSCNDDPKISIIETIPTANSLTFRVECKNERKVERGTINLYLYKNYDKTNEKLINAGNISGYKDTKIFNDLDPETSYDLRVTCTFDGELGYEVTVIRDIKTSAIEPSGINSIEDFKNIKYDLTKTSLYELESDIDFSGEEGFTPITNESNEYFKGTFDGKGHTIKNLTIKSTNKKTGIFAGVTGTIKNLNIQNLTIEMSHKSGVTSTDILQIGGLTGYLEGTIENVNIENIKIVFEDTYSSGTEDRSAIGTVAGYIEAASKGSEVKSAIKNCSVTGEIKHIGQSSATIGGLVGISDSGENADVIEIVNSKVDLKLDTKIAYMTKVGGFVGNSDSLTNITNCYAKTNIILNNEKASTSSKIYVGGLIAESRGTVIEKSVVDTVINVTSSSQSPTIYVGTLVGNNTSGSSAKAENVVVDGNITVSAAKVPADKLFVGNLYAGFYSYGEKNFEQAWSNTTCVVNDNSSSFDVTTEGKINVNTYANATSFIGDDKFSSEIWEVSNNKLILK